METADRKGFESLLAPDADLEAAREFARGAIRDGVTRTVVVPQLLVPKSEDEGTAYDLTVDVFTETGNRGRLQTWTLGVTRPPADPDAAPTIQSTPWLITEHASVGSVVGLYHLTLSRDRQFDASNLVIAGEDMTLRMTDGVAFVSETDTGTTGLALVGDGTMTFDPEPEAERGQVQIFSGREVLEADFTHAFVRVNPQTFAARVSTAALTETAFDDSDFDEAQEFFDEVAGLSYAVDLSDFSDRQWSLSPSVGDFVAEIRTRRYGDLTYAQAQRLPEDVTLYQRGPPSRIIALYPSARQREVRGRYFDDQDTMSYDVLDYDVVASFEPAGTSQETFRARAIPLGCWIEGTTRLAVRVTGANLRTMTLRLADELDVQAVTSRELGPLLFFRMHGQNSVVVNLPGEAPIGTEFTVVVTYAGLLPAQEPDENWIGRARFLEDETTMFGVGEWRYIYSNSSDWYPHSPVSDYATATMQLTVPADYGVVATGDPGESNPPVGSSDEETGVRSYEFLTLQPARYLSAVISRFWPHDIPSQEIALVDDGAARPGAQVRSGVRYDRMSLTVETNPRTRKRLDDYYGQATDIFQFYSSLVGDLPYPVFTLTLTDAYLPGGHSPAYFSVLSQPLPLNPGIIWTWESDPVAFSDVDYFFLAHELAHQWWGQAVGWKNYHERWLSEGLAQYFAALYVQKDLGDKSFEDVISQMRRWGMRHSDEGPVYLGYRLGAIENKPRIFRALVYNKGAMVLHMLRRLIGDDAFFNGLRRYYDEMRFKNAGTDDLIRAFETEAGRSLEGFFEQWIHEADLPELRFDYRTEERAGETAVVLRFEQGPKVFEVPVTVTLRYRSGEQDTAVIPITESVTEVRLPLSGQLRGVDVNKDDAALVEIRR